MCAKTCVRATERALVRRLNQIKLPRDAFKIVEGSWERFWERKYVLIVRDLPGNEIEVHLVKPK